MALLAALALGCVVLALGFFALAWWLQRPWDLDGGEYRDADGHEYGRIKR